MDNNDAIRAAFTAGWNRISVRKFYNPDIQANRWEASFSTEDVTVTAIAESWLLALAEAFERTKEFNLVWRRVIWDDAHPIEGLQSPYSQI